MLVDIWTNIIQTVPGSCYLCRDSSAGTSVFCEECWLDLGSLPVSNKSPRIIDGRERLLAGQAWIDELACVLPYQFPADRLILALKYQNQLILARELGRRMADHISNAGLVLPDFILAVPLHPLRLFRRGYNQSLEISRQLARQLEVPLLRQGVGRSRNTRPQFELSPEERKTNMKQAFACSVSLEGQSIAIVDDIVTTGHTATELAKELKRAGADKVSLWACARAHT